MDMDIDPPDQYNSQQQDIEHLEYACLLSLKHVYRSGLEADARILASALGLSTQLEQELKHANQRTAKHEVS